MLYTVSTVVSIALHVIGATLVQSDFVPCSTTLRLHSKVGVLPCSKNNLSNAQDPYQGVHTLGPYFRGINYKKENRPKKIKQIKSAKPLNQKLKSN